MTPGDTRAERRPAGERTHAAILDEAIKIASVEGVAAVTIGRLADALGLSKSGVYAHFGSKERLHLETVEAAREIFGREVIGPAFEVPDGVQRLEAICGLFLDYVERRVFPGGCFFASLLGEFDAQDGQLHEEVVADQTGWMGLIESAIGTAKARKELRPDTDVGQLAFELNAALELANYFYVLHRDVEMIRRGRSAIEAAIQRAST